MKMKNILGELDELLVDIGRYPSKKELREDAMRALLRAKPELRRDMAIELYKKKKVSLSKAAEICGVNIEDFKELLKERGIKVPIPEISLEEMDKEIEKILGTR
jgi:predicted HTH domain antitoxin